MARKIETPEPEFDHRPEIDPEKAFFIMTKLREFQAKEGNVASPYSESENGSNAVDDGMREVLEDTPHDPVLRELRQFVAGLNVDERATLIGLVFVGRGDFDAADWEGALREARQRDLRSSLRTLITTPLAADYIEDAMGVFGETFEEYEQRHL